ncbi:hypothetical protein [Pelagicoccus sp. SDUM812003]|uniref:hypothetical protein n=1 Tax=Pelagicoccus sp. SDUM812003 TaxID=3041267 RepID=UPI0028101E93|nr:hypothetical protein [Pelagicoccus sp. SDUM812003]MDQ8204203.1 hypothetical protein [Pelagicoccus sp. SDUM812003]
MSSLLKIGLGIFAFLFLLSFYSSCSNRIRYNDTYQVTVQQTNIQDAASGLDLQAVGEMVKRASTGAEFERLLNDPAVAVNNLDLDEDGLVDYIKVTEYGEGDVKGFSLTVDLGENQTQEVATIEIEKTSDGQANIQTHGNPHLYGQSHYYHSRTSLTDLLILGWLFSGNRPYYSSPWGYNNYPNDYRRWTPMGGYNYQRRADSYRSGSSWSQANSSTLSKTPTSPNATKNATNIKAPLRNPTASQKSFQARNPSKQIRSGGFGKSSATQSSSPSFRSSSSSSFRSGGK